MEIDIDLMGTADESYLATTGSDEQGYAVLGSTDGIIATCKNVDECEDGKWKVEAKPPDSEDDWIPSLGSSPDDLEPNPVYENGCPEWDRPGNVFKDSPYRPDCPESR